MAITFLACMIEICVEELCAVSLDELDIFFSQVNSYIRFFRQFINLIAFERAFLETWTFGISTPQNYTSLTTGDF